ncbi:MAG: hypothetical protein J5969_04250 [Lachnospiraceae bacterium]|nr:hypothetical protein [Lachnospiraceae bacterium]
MPGRNSFSSDNGEKHIGAANTRRAIVVAAAAAAALVVLVFCTRSSFLFPMNNWDDANSYFTMGKSMMHGILIYRDIFDQKGPWLYFLYGLCSLVSRTTFAGVFLMEIAFGVLDLVAAYRIFRLRLGEAASLALMAPSLAVMCATRSFYWGGSAEELCLPAILWTLYLVMRELLGEGGQAGALSGSSTGGLSGDSSGGLAGGSSGGSIGEKRSGLPAPFSYPVIFAAGLMSGYVAGIKFTILGFFFAFMVLVMFLSRSVKRFLISCAVFLAGMFLPFVPWIIYFGVRGALADWYRVYIYANVFLYSTFGAADKGESLYDKVYNLSKILYWLFRVNLPYFLMTGAGMLWMLVRKGADLVSRFALILMFGLTFVGIFIGGSDLPYYSLPLAAFAVPGFLAVGVVVGKLLPSVPILVEKRGEVPAGEEAATAAPAEEKFTASPLAVRRAAICAFAISLLVAGAFSWYRSQSRYFLSYEKDDVFLTRFAQDIRDDVAAGIVSEPTLLNYNCLDCGLYTAADIYPSCYWFQTQTLPTDVIRDEQERYAKEELIDYIVVYEWYPGSFEENYETIDTFDQVMGEERNTYYLLRKKTLGQP